MRAVFWGRFSPALKNRYRFFGQIFLPHWLRFSYNLPEVHDLSLFWAIWGPDPEAVLVISTPRVTASQKRSFCFRLEISRIKLFGRSKRLKNRTAKSLSVLWPLILVWVFKIFLVFPDRKNSQGKKRFFCTCVVDENSIYFAHIILVPRFANLQQGSFLLPFFVSGSGGDYCILLHAQNVR